MSAGAQVQGGCCRLDHLLRKNPIPRAMAAVFWHAAQRPAHYCIHTLTCSLRLSLQLVRPALRHHDHLLCSNPPSYIVRQTISLQNQSRMQEAGLETISFVACISATCTEEKGGNSDMSTLPRQRLAVDWKHCRRIRVEISHCER